MATIIDMRSDTVTRPTPGMLDAMYAAEVGDDVFGDDPTVIELQETAAALLGKEAALLVPTGTMANQVCIRAHTEPGDEIVVEAEAHIYVSESGAYAAMSGVSIARVEARRGIMTADAVAAAIRPPGGWSHFPPTRLVCVENAANSGGGTVYPMARLHEIAAVAHERSLRLHLDGARVFNAAVALGVPVNEIAAPFDTVSFCLSKGLGCPIGSVIVGSRELIDRCHRFRKMFGGGMRQAGYLAAAGLYALQHHVERLADDHRRARELGKAMAEVKGIEVDLEGVLTNMIYADVGGTGRDAQTFAAELEAGHGVRMVPVSPTTVRAVAHIDVDDRGIERAIDGVRKIAG